MKTAGCLLIVVFEIFLFGIIGMAISNKYNNDDSTDSLNQNNNSSVEESNSSSEIGTYVGPYTDRNGHFHQGHVRKSYNLNPNASLNRARSRYYNHTHIRKHSR